MKQFGNHPPLHFLKEPTPISIDPSISEQFFHDPSLCPNFKNEILCLNIHITTVITFTRPFKTVYVHRSSRLQVFFKICVLFAIFTENHRCWKLTRSFGNWPEGHNPKCNRYLLWRFVSFSLFSFFVFCWWYTNLHDKICNSLVSINK